MIGSNSLLWYRNSKGKLQSVCKIYFEKNIRILNMKVICTGWLHETLHAG